jgi:two-component system response regulator YesN
MAKVLIIDDEPVVRRGLKTVINWEDFDCFICGEASNGIEGLQKIDELKPDIVMVDIKMPEMNGLEVIKYARERGHKCKFIILSGFNDFEFAQKAIRLGVNAYLLKPIEEDELKELIVNFTKELSQEKQIQETIDNGIMFKKKRLIKSIIGGEDSNILVNSYGDELISAYNKYSSYCIAIINIKNFDNESCIELLNKLLINERDLEVCDYKGYVFILFKGYEQKSVERFLIRLRKRLKEEYGKEIFIAVGRIVSSIDMLAVSFYDASAFLDNQFLYEHLEIKYYSDSNSVLDNLERSKTENLSVGSLTEELYLAIELNDMDKAKNSIEKLIEGFEAIKLNPEKIRGICVGIIAELLKKLENNYNELRGVYNHDDILNSIYDKGSMVELKEFMLQNINDASKRISSSNSDLIMKRIIDYVNKNYDKELKVEILAERFNYNNAYLGQLFKSTTGEYFNAYVDKLRIENAKKFLLMGLKTAEVAQKTGFKNLDYFYNKFKKHVGVGPSEYRKNRG